MVYFCADDYGISHESNNHIEECIKKGALNRISVLPNGDFNDLKERLAVLDAKISLHINLVEGRPLSNPDDIDLIATKDGYFKHSFIGLFFLSLSKKRKELEKQLYKEIKSQIDFWKDYINEDISLSIDSHQHTHMIPLIFKTLLRVIEDENLKVEYLRVPSEPLIPYILTPSLYTSYSLSGIIKQWLLKFCWIFNKGKFKKKKIKTAYFMGVMFSGKMSEENIKKLFPLYSKISKKHNSDIEITLHPGYLKTNQSLIEGCREDFQKFYLSPWRKKEYDALINFKF